MKIGLYIDGAPAERMRATATIGRGLGHHITGAAHGPTSYGFVEPGASESPITER